jgi:hypothetical protein
MSYIVKPLNADELEALVREAQAERDRQLKEFIVRGAKAVARLARTVGSAISAAYDAERKRTAANAGHAMHRRWVGPY